MTCVVVTMPEPNFIIAPPTIAITISRGRTCMIFSIAPERPMIRAMTPAMINAPVASLKLYPARAVPIRVAPGIEYVPETGTL